MEGDPRFIPTRNLFRTVMTETLAIALAQMNPTVGDVDGNAGLIRAARNEAAAGGADLVVCGELMAAGYPPEDLVLKPAFQDRIEAAMGALAGETADGGPALLVGAPWRHDGKLFNAALLLDGGTIAAVRFKHELPNYGVFDEKRVFAAGPYPEPIPFRSTRLGVMVCEDMWFPGVTGALAEAGGEILVVLNSSPFEVDKTDSRLDLARERVAETGLPLVYVNLVGGQDELVFDGASFVLNADGERRAQAPTWQSRLLPTRWARENGGVWTCEAGPMDQSATGPESVYRAMVVGVRDYVDKNGFPGVVIGLSGGIDSALTAAVAVDALGPERVRCVMMPSPYTSTESLDDAAAVAGFIGARLDTVPIEAAMKAFDTMLEGALAGPSAGITAENIQARARALVLMALSNELGYMVLTTGNKSEMSVGYATLYGDMAGGFSALKNVYKTTVFALSRWRNQVMPDGVLGPTGRVMPERAITKPPSAELKPDQTDQDTLPPYDQLDAILEGLIEEECSVEELVSRGFESATVRRIWRMLDRAEYKRRQAPPGVKITHRDFGRDRRYPITNRFTDQV